MDTTHRAIEDNIEKIFRSSSYLLNIFGVLLSIIEACLAMLSQEAISAEMSIFICEGNSSSGSGHM